MYFQWNIISPPEIKNFSFSYFIVLPVAIGENNPSRKSSTHLITFPESVSTSLCFMFYGNAKTITEDENMERRGDIFSFNVEYDSEKIWWCCRKLKAKKGEEKINQNVHTSFVSFDWQLIIDWAKPDLCGGRQRLCCKFTAALGGFPKF